MMRLTKATPFRLLFLAISIVIICTPTSAFAQREIDPAGGGEDGGVTAVTIRTKTRVSVETTGSQPQAPALEQAEQPTPAATTQPVAGGPAVWTNGATICVAAEYGLPWHWNHTGGSDGLPRIPMRLVNDHYEVNLGSVPNESFSFGFVDKNESAGQRENRWLPGNVAGFKQGSPWVIPHTDNPGSDFLMKADGRRMWVASPEEVAAYRSKLAAGR